MGLRAESEKMSNDTDKSPHTFAAIRQRMFLALLKEHGSLAINEDGRVVGPSGEPIYGPRGIADETDKWPYTTDEAIEYPIGPVDPYAFAPPFEAWHEAAGTALDLLNADFQHRLVEQGFAYAQWSRFAPGVIEVIVAA